MEKGLEEENKVLLLYQQLLLLWNKRSASGMAGLFAIDGTSIGFDGSVLNGQKEIYSVMDQIFANHPTAAYAAIANEVRLINSESAILRAIAGMIPEGHADIFPAVNAIQTLVAVKWEGDWKIALFQNTPAAFHGRPELSEQLSGDLRTAIQSGKSLP